MKIVQKGSWVQVRVRRSEGGSSNVGQFHEDYLSYPLVRCRVAQVNICGAGIYGLEYEDGHPIGLPFWREDIVSVEG